MITTCNPFYTVRLELNSYNLKILNVTKEMKRLTIFPASSCAFCLYSESNQCTIMASVVYHLQTQQCFQPYQPFKLARAMGFLAALFMPFRAVSQ